MSDLNDNQINRYFFYFFEQEYSKVIFISFMIFSFSVSVFAASENSDDKKGPKKEKEVNIGDVGNTEYQSIKNPEGEQEKLQPQGPTVQIHATEKKISKKIVESREKQIELLKKLLSLGPDPKEIADLKFRLAELFWEKSKYYFFQYNELDEKIQASKSAEEKKEFKKNREGFFKDSATWRKRAVKLYEEIINESPGYHRLPEVLFHYALNQWEEKQFEDSLKYFRRIIKDYPNHPLHAKAWLRFGEYYFLEGDFHRAIKSYEASAKLNDKETQTYSIYKEAWCYYNLSEFEKAIEKFREVLKLSDGAGQMSKTSRIALRKEALKDILLSYSHVGNPEKAKMFFNSLGKGEADWMIPALANLWFEQGKNSEALYLYRQLLKEEPKSPKVPLRQARIVELAARLGDRDLVVHECKKLVEICMVSGGQKIESDVSKTKDKEFSTNYSADIQEARQLVEAVIRRFATTWHSESTKTKNETTMKQSSELYELYLKLFVESKYGYTMKFNYGDLLFRMNEFEKAAKTLMEVVYAKKGGKHEQEAIEDAVHAYDEAMQDATIKYPEKPKDKLPQETPLPPLLAEYVKAIDYYLTHFSQDAKYGPEIRYKSAKFYYDFNHLEESLKRFSIIIDKYPTHANAEVSVELTADIYNAYKDWVRMEEWASKMIKRKALIQNRPNLKKNLESYLEHAAFALATQKDKDGKEHSSNYLQYVKKYPKTKLGDRALYNAANLLDKEGNPKEGVKVRQQLIDTYPDSEFAKDSYRFFIDDLERKGKYTQAAKYLEQYVAKYPQESFAQEALLVAAMYRDVLGQTDVAMKHQTDLIAKYPKSEKTPEIILDLAENYIKQKKLGKAAESYELLISKYSNKLPLVMIALMKQYEVFQQMREDGKANRSKNIFEKKYKDWKNQKTPPKDDEFSPEVHQLAASIALEQVIESYEPYAKMSLESPDNEKKFKKSLDQKVQKRDLLMKEFEQVIKQYKEAHSVIASLYYIGKIWNNFGESLLNTPCPKVVASQGQCDEYRSTLDERAQPLKDNAKTFFRQAVEKSAELSTFNKYSKLAINEVEKEEVKAELMVKKDSYSPKSAAIMGAYSSL